MNEAIRAGLLARTLALADDELILGHRDSEWCGHAPILEEDIAFANLASNEIGHAWLYYQVHAEAADEDPASYPDHLVFFRDAAGYRCAQMAAHPKGDWAFSMLRQYLYDQYEAILLPALMQSQYGPLAEAAGKIRSEEWYHLRHTKPWVRRLGLGTAESQQRMQRALDALWPLCAQLFAPVPDEAEAVAAGYLPELRALRPAWEESTRQHLTESGLKAPDLPTDSPARTAHTAHLVDLLAEMQKVARLVPGGKW